MIMEAEKFRDPWSASGRPRKAGDVFPVKTRQSRVPEGVCVSVPVQCQEED